MTVTLKRWDSTEHLQTEEDIKLYLEACFEEAGDDAAFIAKALGNVAKARSMTQLAKDTGLGRESLYKALSGEGNPCNGQQKPDTCLGSVSIKFPFKFERG